MRPAPLLQAGGSFGYRFRRHDARAQSQEQIDAVAHVGANIKTKSPAGDELAIEALAFAPHPPGCRLLAGAAQQATW